jgi:hypothetical protein
VHDLVHHLEVEILLGIEIAIEGALRQSGGGADVLDANVAVTVV